ncbi:RteC domain-containing protein [Pedobacter helvus]|uniref:RteC domain-containing protein n=1 Tax=Pedobacter helvus TaxID=2563444 RepID=A0ABW9JLY5_9SPHI|nr:RteC domain-containing protein [Pedobacter ureilyticus]
MIEQLAKRWLGELEQEMEELLDTRYEGVERLRKATILVERTLKKLRQQVQEKGFSSQDDEIYFFKHLKPKGYHWKIYFLELYTMECGRPQIGVIEQKEWLDREMAYVDRFFEQHHFFYEYYRLDSTELDSLYFLRGADKGSLLLPEVPELNPAFGTEGDYLFAKFMAFEKLRDWLVEKARYLLANPHADIGNISQAEELRWTGDSINLAELAFGIHRTGQVNKGTASIGAIFRWLEEKLQVSIGIPSKRLSEIRRRTTISRTRYLDEMIEMVIQKLDKEDEYHPDKNQRK